MVDKREEPRDPGEHDQNVAIAKGLTDSPKVIKEVEQVAPGICPTCKRNMVNA